jgi:hypothetical protein
MTTLVEYLFSNFKMEAVSTLKDIIKSIKTERFTNHTGKFQIITVQKLLDKIYISF